MTSLSQLRIHALVVQRRSDPASLFLPLDVSMRFGRRLRTLLEVRNLQELSLSEGPSLNSNYLTGVEAGRKSVSLRTLELIALGIGTSLSELLKDL